MNKSQYENILNVMQDTTCKMIIAELESIREELHTDIDKKIDIIIDEKIKNYKD